VVYAMPWPVAFSMSFLPQFETTMPEATKVTRQDDPQWSQLVYWINAGLVNAEERGITQRTAADEMPLVEIFGPSLRNMFRQSVNAVGNYGEVYARHVQGEAPRGGPHELNDLSGPQLYPSPGLFGDFDSSQRKARRERRRHRT
jgi:hypothetical protein